MKDYIGDIGDFNPNDEYNPKEQKKDIDNAFDFNGREEDINQKYDEGLKSKFNVPGDINKKYPK